MVAHNRSEIERAIGKVGGHGPIPIGRRHGRVILGKAVVRGGHRAVEFIDEQFRSKGSRGGRGQTTAINCLQYAAGLYG